VEAANDDNHDLEESPAKLVIEQVLSLPSKAADGAIVGNESR
jgi:hypothetical protein